MKKIISKILIIFIIMIMLFVYGLNKQDGSVLWCHKIGNSILNTVCPIDGSNCIVTSSEGTVTRIHVD